jgi:site-specific recombinase XerD
MPKENATVQGQCYLCGQPTARVFYRTRLTEPEAQQAKNGDFVARYIWLCPRCAARSQLVQARLGEVAFYHDYAQDPGVSVSGQFALTSMSQGQEAKSSMQTQPDVITQYQDHLTRAGKSSHTVKAYTQDLAAFGQWLEQTTGEDFHPRAVDSRDIIEYRGYLLRGGAKPATVNRRLIALRRFFQWAKQQGLAASSPFEILEKVLVREQKDTAPRWLDHQEQLALLRAVRKGGNTRDLALIQTLLGTGLRISEAADLKVSDLEISERSGWLHVWAGKGTKARDIPLDNRTRQALSAYLAERQDDGSGRLFLGQRGPINEAGVNYLVKKYAYQAQLENCTSHTLRHTFAKNLVDAGTPLDQVATLLGHESLDTTRVYTKPSAEDLERAVRQAAGEL